MLEEDSCQPDSYQQSLGICRGGRRQRHPAPHCWPRQWGSELAAGSPPQDRARENSGCKNHPNAALLWKGTHVSAHHGAPHLPGHPHTAPGTGAQSSLLQSHPKLVGSTGPTWLPPRCSHRPHHGSGWGSLLPLLCPQSTQGRWLAWAQSPSTRPTQPIPNALTSPEPQRSSSPAPQTPPSMRNGAFILFFDRKVIYCPKSQRKVIQYANCPNQHKHRQLARLAMLEEGFFPAAPAGRGGRVKDGHPQPG